MSTVIHESSMMREERSVAAVDRVAARSPGRRASVLFVSAGVSLGAVALMLTPTFYLMLSQRHMTPGSTNRPAMLVLAGSGSIDPVAKARGEMLFTQGCNACHGDDARGKPSLGKDLVHSAFVRSQNETQLVNFLKRGRDISDPLNTTKVPMPPKGGNPALNDNQLKDLAAYVRGIQAQ